MSRLIRKTTIETLWIYVLASLAREGPTYPYRVRKIIEENFGFKPSTVTLYTVIYRMEREGLLTKNEEGLYVPTEKGYEEFHEALKYLEGVVAKLRSTVAGGSHGP